MSPGMASPTCMTVGRVYDLFPFHGEDESGEGPVALCGCWTAFL